MSMEIIQYGKQYKDEKKEEIRFDFTQEERKLCPKCNFVLKISEKVCPSCGYIFQATEAEEKE